VMPMLPLTLPSLRLFCDSLRLLAIAGAFQGFFMSANRLQVVLFPELHNLAKWFLKFELCIDRQ